MIELNRLNGDPFLLNPVLIEQIQAHPDTTITLLNGKKLVVKNDISEVAEKVMAFYKEAGILGTVKEAGEVNE